MTTRRSFLQGTITAAVAIGSSPALANAHFTKRAIAPAEVGAYVLQGHQLEAVAAELEVRAPGLVAHFDQRFTPVHARLCRVLASRQTIAGITTTGTFMLIAQLARDAGFTQIAGYDAGDRDPLTVLNELGGQVSVPLAAHRLPLDHGLTVWMFAARNRALV